MLVLSFKLVGPMQWELSFNPVQLPEGSAKKDRAQMARAANHALEAAFCKVLWMFFGFTNAFERLLADGFVFIYYDVTSWRLFSN